jgi:hypothetical protein
MNRPADHVTPLARILDALDRCGCVTRSSGQGWRAQCPAHEDRAPSLSLREGADGSALLFCFAGCETKAVLQALGLRLSDLYPGDGRRRRGR